MHCPHCRADNATNTRFCVACGAVLVEEAPGGGRRRVLRPWGLRKSAPLTVSPDLPHDEPSSARARGPGQLDFWLAAGVVATLGALTALYPSLRSAAAPSPTPTSETVVASAAVVTMPALATVHETRLAAPALVEPAPRAERSAASSRARPAATPEPKVAVIEAAPSAAVVPTPVVAEAAPVQVARAPVPEAPRPAPDRWQPLRDALAGCQPLGLLQRATCEQGARLAHCSGLWGLVPLCPAGRTEFGQ